MLNKIGTRFLYIIRLEAQLIATARRSFWSVRMGWLMMLAALMGMVPGLANAVATFAGPGIYSSFPNNNYSYLGVPNPIVYDAATSTGNAQGYYLASTQTWEITSVGTAGYFQIKNLPSGLCLGDANSGLMPYTSGSANWVTCPTAAAPSLNAQWEFAPFTYTAATAEDSIQVKLAPGAAGTLSGKCLSQAAQANNFTHFTQIRIYACDLPSTPSGSRNSNYFGGSGTSALTSKLHLLLTQANTNTVVNDNTTTKTITVTSCSNAAVGTCTPVTSDNQQVTVSIVTGTATLSSATVQLSAGVGTFTIKSGTAGTVQLKVVPSNASYPGDTGTCNRNGALTGESTWTTTNVECRVTFAAAGPGHIRFEYDPAYALLCKPQPITMKACTEAASAVGTAAPTCTAYTGGVTITPTATTIAAGATLTWNPAGAITIDATGIRTGVTLANTDDTQPVALGLASGTLECYNTSTNKVVDCTSALAYHVCTFDAVEHGAAWGTNLYTKIADTAFPYSGIDLMMGYNGAINTDYAGTPTVELVDDTSATACASKTALTGVTLSPASTEFSAGRLTLGVTVSQAVKKVKVRIKDAAYSPGCALSTDSFTIRPAQLALSSDTGVIVAGSQAGGNSPGFKLYAQAQNAAGSAIIGYAGAPQLDSSLTFNDSNGLAIAATGDSGTAATLSWSGTKGFGAADPATGISNGSFFYNDFGPLTLPAYAAIDNDYVSSSGSGDAVSDCIIGSYSNVADDGAVTAANKGKYGCNFRSQNATVATPRFRVNHYDVNNSMGTSCTGFTYMGQPVAVQLDVTAMNADGNRMERLLAATPLPRPIVAVSSLPAGLLTGAAGSSGLPLTAAIDWPATVTGGRASGNNAACTTAACTYVRPATRTDPVTASITVSVSDSDAPSANNIKTLNGAVQTPWLASATASGSYRYGILKLDNAYGSELLPLYVPVRALYWNGSTWLTNTADSCTQIPAAGNVAISNYNPAGNLSSANVQIVSVFPLQLSNGVASIKFRSPGLGSTGSADIALNLEASGNDNSCNSIKPVSTAANMSWLLGNWCGSAGYIRDPHGRITFGTAKSPFLYMRERY